MEKFLTNSNIILFIITILSIIFGIYNHFKKPQYETETKLAVGEERDKNKATVLAQTEAEGKASLLAQQVLTEKEYNSKKFIELGERFNKTDEKIEVLTESINDMNLNLTRQLTKVQTIVEEHLKIK